jgi:hypothetical protein
MTSFVLIRHKVREFEEWKRGYASLLPQLKALGRVR